jgi:hypothetical protein
MSTLPRHLQSLAPTQSQPLVSNPAQIAMMQLEELRRLNTILDVGLTEIYDLLERLHESIRTIAMKQKE